MASTEEAIQTLYVNNLNDKLPKEQLKEELYLLFSQFGTILDVVALKTERMKGQAWIFFCYRPKCYRCDELTTRI